jgi:tRNA dimethylallyltransferase
VRRAWEVLRATGRGLADWQADTPPPLLPLARAQAVVLEAPKDWLDPRIERRFDAMLAAGALAEAAANRAGWDPSLPSARAIGAAELIAHLEGRMTLEAARAAAVTATRQYAKRQRTWFRARMGGWARLGPEGA